MTLTSLLVCLDGEAAQVVGRVLEELSIGVESCPDPSRAGIRMAQERFDVIVLDCEAQATVATLLRDTRVSRINDSTLAVAIVPGQETIRELFSLGVNFVLYKPVSYERALSTLRAARSVMRKDKRRNSRAPVHAHATIDYANVSQEKATLIDVAHDGMSVQFGKKLPPTNKVYFQFMLPEQNVPVRLSGQVVWQDWNGRAGVQFVDVPKTSRRLLDEFLTVSFANSGMDGASTVTVELEVPLPNKHVSSAQVESQESDQEQGQSSEGPMQTSPDRYDRRGETRYPCRLGAEVYRTGKNVPYHCCLTDLSPGGCYLEVPSPFPHGAEVEITVRTHDLKLRLRGEVQSSHPGYGMGIAFELKSMEEQFQVRKLTEFVAAANRETANNESGS
jgi:hypothetical protein